MTLRWNGCGDTIFPFAATPTLPVSEIEKTKVLMISMGIYNANNECDPRYKVSQSDRRTPSNAANRQERKAGIPYTTGAAPFKYFSIQESLPRATA